MRRATQYVGSMHEMYRRRVAIAFGLPEDTGTEVLARRVDEERLVPASTWSSLPEPAAGQVQAFSSSPRSWANAREETASESLQMTPGWSDVQDRSGAHGGFHGGQGRHQPSGAVPSTPVCQVLAVS
jgi:hypothetical protein